ncbi:acetate kinase [bacterium]|nr:acetate kinase [bacterium]MBU1990799.1 acetate kinase [bacterium]
MKIAVINSGSSSIKFQLFEMPRGEVLAYVLIEKIGEFISDTTFKYQDKKLTVTSVVKDHHEGLEKIISLLNEYGIVKDFASLDAIGHRVVHGGEEFHSATLINEHVIQKIQELIPLAPLHNPANLEGILVSRKKAPLVPQVAVFDTAFHFHMPKEAYLYAIDYELYEKNNIRRYGFHGSSHAYVLEETSKYLKKDASALNIITLHLGNGSSACAIKNGISIDTSMGFTPLEGLMMGTRSGDIDPSIIFYMQKELGLSVDEVDTILNKKSGLIGICGKNDVRSILETEDEKAKLALTMMARRIKKYIGAYMALLGHVDAIVFTGGIGENARDVRAMALEEMACGIVIDKEKNRENETLISAKNSSVKLLVIKTDEELYIARESLSILHH